MLGLTIAGVVAAMVLWAVIFSKTAAEPYEEVSVSTALWIAAISVTAGTVILAVSVFAQRGIARVRFEDREDQARRARLGANRDQKADSGKLGELMAANRALLNEYQKPVRAQAKSSYICAQVAISIGFVLLSTGVGLVLITNSNAARISLATLSAIGSGVAGYVARTFLRVYERAQEQLNFYYREPLVTSYLLTAERLAEELGGEGKDRTYELMIEEIIRFARHGVERKHPVNQQ